MTSVAPPIVTSSHIPTSSKYQLPQLPSIPAANPQRQILDAFRLAAASLIAEAWGEDPAKIFEGCDVGKKGADLAVAIPRFKKGKPDEWAAKVLEAFQPSNYLSKVSFEKPFLAFTFNKESFTYHVLRQIQLCSLAARQEPSNPTLPYGAVNENEGKLMVIDFSSPNIAKPFHAGHLRSTIIGAVISNMHEAFGWKVKRINYLGDWGTQYGKLSIGFDRYGSEEELVKDPIKHLFKVYVKINEDDAAEKARYNAGEEIDSETTVHALAKKVFKDMEDGEPKAIAQWSRFRDLSIEALVGVYDKLNIHFDEYWGESQVRKESMQRAIDICLEKKLTCEDRGALLVDLMEWKMDRAIIRKADGTTIYLTRDLGGAYDKYEKYHFDKHIYVVQAAQSLHFRQLYKTLELMEEPYYKEGVFEHVSFGMVNGMSTRKGTVVFLDDILEEAKEVMHEQMRSNEEKYRQIEDPETTSAIIGQTAVKIQDLSGKRVNDYTFNMQRCTSFEGDFGPFIQYSHVRLCSVQRKNPNVPIASSSDDIDISILSDPKIYDMIYHLSIFPTTLRTAYTNNEPSTLVHWCFKISHLVGAAWESVKVSGAEEEEAKARLFLYLRTREVLAYAMRLLSLTPIERM
ncbi:hypothetical protein TREMEDRAFT_44762 [Tremella mesenterica DSM 1558]|uniref:uncharacterized protein n=1 Tax=Tremella mesenterica (strain ATCC 24925 / CBS 8224 / DSM 1558 / NBRC 9311 / NRRL Y-6157 / RJB 2259-6 / UBC 559-6) TaxID=578456 RepID=UPI0003F495D1|nr:uncharacterized protein TREMEDRAFT_44762 [Tremella mesenterica DSM 1558]EIW68395.1 hypothetical protein TREMEDRAFT_44762 [Tremella mesenterica DSM 1558]